ncbi:hypothetical protein AB6A23_07920 [Paenibacillus tarimensis]
MRVPQFERYKRTMHSAGVLLLGVVIGAIMYNSMYHYQLYALYGTISELNSMIEERDEEIKSLKDFKDQQTIIKTIHINIEPSEGAASAGFDTQTSVELKKEIKKDFDVLVGRSVYKVASDDKLVRALLDDKIYTDILGKDYIITVRTILLIGTTLDVWIEAKVHEGV